MPKIGGTRRPLKDTFFFFYGCFLGIFFVALPIIIMWMVVFSTIRSSFK